MALAGSEPLLDWFCFGSERVVLVPLGGVARYAGVVAREDSSDERFG